MRVLPKHTILRRFAILLAAGFVAAAVYSPSPAMATLCGTPITTVWSTGTDLGEGTITTNDGSFTADCLAPSDANTSTFEGTYEDQPLVAEALDEFTYEIYATDDKTLNIVISATDGVDNGLKAAFPAFTLMLSEIEWFDVSGIITGVDVTSSDPDFDLTYSFTDDTIEFTFDGNNANCVPAGIRGDGCTLEFNAIIDITATHIDLIPGIPEPSTLALFLIGLTGLGFAMPRRRRLV